MLDNNLKIRYQQLRKGRKYKPVCERLSSCSFSTPGRYKCPLHPKLHFPLLRHNRRMDSIKTKDSKVQLDEKINLNFEQGPISVISTWMRFELMRAEHNRLAVCRLNHSATTSGNINDGQIIQSAPCCNKLVIESYRYIVPTGQTVT